MPPQSPTLVEDPGASRRERGSALFRAAVNRLTCYGIGSAAGSKTLAATVILVDRALGLVALTVVASLGAFAASLAGLHVPGARWLWTAAAAGIMIAIPVIAIPELVGHLLAPLRALNRPWVTERAQKLEEAALKFRAAPTALAGAFGGALVVQVTVVAFYLLTAQGLSVPLPVFLGAVLIPVSLAMQMARHGHGLVVDWWVHVPGSAAVTPKSGAGARCQRGHPGAGL